jgi:hypothetical protein
MGDNWLNSLNGRSGFAASAQIPFFDFAGGRRRMHGKAKMPKKWYALQKIFDVSQSYYLDGVSICLC